MTLSSFTSNGTCLITVNNTNMTIIFHMPGHELTKAPVQVHKTITSRKEL